MNRVITNNSYDIYYSFNHPEWVERECVLNLIDLFIKVYGNENILVNDMSSFPIVSGYGFGGRPDVVLIQHPWTRTWSVWDTNDMSGWLVSLIWGKGIPDYRYYVLPAHEFSPETMVSAFTLSPRAKNGKPSHIDPYFKCPYPGQNINRRVMDELYHQNLKALPYTIFRGRSCQLGDKNSRHLFVKHLVDIIKSKNLKEVVIIADELDVYMNVDQLPHQYQKNIGVYGRDYLHEIATSSGCISLPGFADVSRRDMETLGMGRAVIRPPYVCNLWGDSDTKPFLHSRQCIKPIESTSHRYGWEYLDEDLVRSSCLDMVENSLEIIANASMRNRMREVARTWYETYCSPVGIANYLFGTMMTTFRREHVRWENYKRYETNQKGV
jgi:hypothetical protein